MTPQAGANLLVVLLGIGLLARWCWRQAKIHHATTKRRARILRIQAKIAEDDFDDEVAEFVSEVIGMDKHGLAAWLEQIKIDARAGEELKDLVVRKLIEQQAAGLRAEIRAEIENKEGDHGQG